MSRFSHIASRWWISIFATCVVMLMVLSSTVNAAPGSNAIHTAPFHGATLNAQVSTTSSGCSSSVQTKTSSFSSTTGLGAYGVTANSPHCGSSYASQYNSETSWNDYTVTVPVHLSGFHAVRVHFSFQSN